MSRRKSDQFIGGYQIVAGAAGILLALFLGVVALRTGAETARLSVALVIGGMIAVFGGVVLAGVLLLEGHPAGRILSSGVQVLQIPIVAASSWHWMFLAGAYLMLTWFGGEPRLSFGLKANLEVAWAGAQQVTGFGVNVIPLAILGLLWRPASVPAPSALSEQPSVDINPQWPNDRSS